MDMVRLTRTCIPDRGEKKITKSPILAFYDPQKELIKVNDASDYGLGSVQTQEGRPVAFTSRTLSSTEKNYALIDKEMLAAVHGLEKFHHYTYGRQVHVIADHKPLVSIVGKPLSKAPKRLQSVLLWAQAYNYVISYRPGVQIPVADALSRAPTTTQPPDTEFENVNSLSLSPFKPRRLSEIKQATAAGYTLMQLMDTIIKGWPNKKSRSASPRTLITEMNSQYSTASSSEKSEWSFRHPCEKTKSMLDIQASTHVFAEPNN